MYSLESFPFEASASLESPKSEIVSSESTSSDRSLSAKVLKLDISSPEYMSSEVPPLKGKALMHEVGIKTDLEMLSDHSSLIFDGESCCEGCSCESCCESFSSDGDCVDDYYSHPEIVAFYKCVNDSGGFDVPLVPEGLDADGLIGPITPLNEAMREYLKPLCIEALDHFNQNERNGYKFVNLVKANSVVTCGMQYYLTFEAKNHEDGTNQTLQAVVLNGFPEEGGGPCLKVLYCKREADFTKADY